MKLSPALERFARRPSLLSTDAGDATLSRSVALVLVPVALLATAVVVQRRRGTAMPVARPAAKATATPKGQGRRKPRSIIRYYALGLLINALERESTRKAVVMALKAARKRA